MFSTGTMLLYSAYALVQQIINNINYEPTWISNFSLPEQDSEGWSIVEPTSTSRIMYVSESGNDSAAQAGDVGVYSLASLPSGTWDNPSGVVEFASITAAMAYARIGFPDFICLKRGDTFDLIGGTNHTSLQGATTSERATMTYYGNMSNPRPIIDVKGTGGYAYYGIYDNSAFIGIHFTCTERDPNHVNFVGFDVVDDYGGVALYRYTAETNPDTLVGVLIEDCKFSFLKIPIYLPCTPYPDDIIIRRNVFDFNYGEVSMGILGSYRGLLLEENYAWHNGFYDVFIGTDGGFNRHWHYNTISSDLTSATTTSITFVDPLPQLLSLPRSVPIKMDDGGLDEYVTVTAISGNVATIDSFDFSVRTSTGGKAFEHIIYGVNSGAGVYHTSGALTTATNTIPTNDPVAQNLQSGMKVNLVGIQGYVYSSTINSVTSNSIILNDTLDFTIDNVVDNDNIYVHCYGASSKNHSFYLSYLTNSIIRNNVSVQASAMHYKFTTGNSVDAIYSSNVSMYGNIGIGGEIAIGAAGNRYSQFTPKLEGWTIADNYILELGLDNMSNRDLAWGIDIQDQDSCITARNFMINTVKRGQTFGIRSTEGYNLNNDLLYNIVKGYGSSGIQYNPNHVDNVIGNVSDGTGFTNDNATFYTFMDSIGQVGGGFDEFNNLMVNRDKNNWVTTDQTLKDYFKNSYSYNGIFAIKNPKAIQNYYEGDNVTIRFDVFSSTDCTFQWKLADGTPIVGETAETYQLTYDDATHGGLVVYCTARDQNGNTVDSTNVTLGLIDRSFAVLTLGDQIDFTSRVLTTGQGFKVKYRCLTQKGRMGGLGSSLGHSLSFRGSGEDGIVFKHTNADEQIAFPNIGAILLDGAEHDIEYTMEASGEYPEILIDGQAYVATIPNSSVGNTSTMTLEFIDSRALLDTYQGDQQEWWDLEFFDTNGTTLDFYALDSLAIDGSTENATVGSGVATLNVDAGTWTLIPPQQPAILSTSPVDNATNVVVESDISITFNVTPILGTGNITITDGTDTRIIDVTNHAGQLSVTGNVLTINLTTNLSNTLSNYYVLIDSTAIKDYIGQNFAGISDPAVFNFITEDVDTQAPILVSSSPTDNAVDVALGSDVVLTFDEPIVLGTGNIIISDGTDTITIDVANHAGQLSVASNVLTINPTSSLANNSSVYYVQIASTAILDGVGNAYVGISDTTTLNFTTVAPPSNQVLSPNDLTSSNWVKEKVSVTSTRMTDTAENGYHRIKQNVALPSAGTTEFFSFEATYVDHQFVGFNIRCADGNYRNATFDLLNGQVGEVYTASSYANPTITPLGGGTFLCEVEVTGRLATEISVQLMNADSTTTGRIYVGTGTSADFANITVAY